MGKTFVGIADDATAAASNPAGLSNLFDPEFSLELSGVNFQTTRMVTADPLTTSTFGRSVAYPSFASFVTPLPNRRVLRDITVAAFFNTLQRYREQFDIPNELPGGGRSTEGGYWGDMNITARAAGFGASYIVTRNVSVGAAITVQQLRNDTRSFEYDGNQPARYRNGSITNDTDAEWSGHVGVLVKPARWMSLGASYQAGTTFHLTTTIVGVFSPENSPPLPARPIATYKDPNQPIEFRIPDRFSVGTALHLHQAVTFVSDVGWVGYAQRVTDGFQIIDFLGQPSAGLKPSLYTFDNVWEVHAGVEFRRYGQGRLLALRGGVFTDPDHQMRFDYERSNKTSVPGNQRRRFDSYHPGTAVGLTAGAGIVLNNRWQLDGAVSVSKNARELVISTVLRLPQH